MPIKSVSGHLDIVIRINLQDSDEKLKREAFGIK